jgi:signal peptidase I
VVSFAHIRSIASLALQLAILGALIAAILFVRTPPVSGHSMEPHIASGEIVLIDTLAYRLGAPTPELYIKRVVAVGGDRVRIDRGTLFVNGTLVDEAYVRFPDFRSFPEIAVPAGSVYVLGDNRPDSEDSRMFGPVRDSDLVGRAIAGIWPLAAVGAL